MNTSRLLPNACRISFAVGNALSIPLASQSADLVFGSPPYLNARTYGIDAGRNLDDWIEFMLACTREGLRVSRGLVLWVVSGTTEDKSYQPGPEGLMYQASRAGIEMWTPACWYKVDPDTGGGCGQPGSGGKQWLRRDWEYVLAFKNPGPLPWADPLFQRIAPKYKPGGAIRTRTKDGSRQPRAFRQPSYANPGNVIKARVGGGHQGDKENHETDAPFPERLPLFFVQGFCRPGGLVVDPFNGSGTTAVMAGYHGRNAIGFDLRPCQVALSLRRLDRRIFEGRSCVSKESHSLPMESVGAAL